MTPKTNQFPEILLNAYLEMKHELGEEQAVLKLIASTSEILRTYEHKDRIDTFVQLFRFNLADTPPEQGRVWQGKGRH